MIRGYERLVSEQTTHLQQNTQVLAQMLERLEPGSTLTEHITYNTQVLTRLCERIEAWDRRMGPR